MEGDAFHADCVGREILDHMVSRWAVLILGALRGGTHRFFELRRRIDGVSDKMLSQTLRTLIRDGLVERSVEPSTPPKVSYALTPLGADLSGPLQQLLEMIRERCAEVVARQETYDRAASPR